MSSQNEKKVSNEIGLNSIGPFGKKKDKLKSLTETTEIKKKNTPKYQHSTRMCTLSPSPPPAHLVTALQEEPNMVGSSGNSNEDEDEIVAPLEELPVPINPNLFMHDANQPQLVTQILEEAHQALMDGKAEYSLRNYEDAKFYLELAANKYAIAYGQHSCSWSHAEANSILGKVFMEMHATLQNRLPNLMLARDYLIRATNIGNRLFTKQILNMQGVHQVSWLEAYNSVMLTGVLVEEINTVLGIANRRAKRLVQIIFNPMVG